jgi:hypothetical protein
MREQDTKRPPVPLWLRRKRERAAGGQKSDTTRPDAPAAAVDVSPITAEENAHDGNNDADNAYHHELAGSDP